MLYMVELAARDVNVAAEWYIAAFGFARELDDPARGFVLLSHPASACRLALKAGGETVHGVKLHFQSADLAADLARLEALGVRPVGELKSSAEGYRRALLAGPDGVTVVLFEWTRG